jgi:hypothetical protein
MKKVRPNVVRTVATAIFDFTSCPYALEMFIFATIWFL